MVFHRLGTKHGSYLKRFNNKYVSNSFWVNKIDKYKYEIISDEKVIDIFTSSTTLNQFILVLLSFNLISSNAEKYIILKNNFNWFSITKAICSISGDKNIDAYRSSRIISFLERINILKSTGLFKDIVGKRGNFSHEWIEGEISWWEKETTKDITRVIDVLERIKNEYKI